MGVSTLIVLVHDCTVVDGGYSDTRGLSIWGGVWFLHRRFCISVSFI